jgi:uncharacterized membrane protein YhaH (DUF805 family)
VIGPEDTGSAWSERGITMQSYLDVIRKYAMFDGRSARTEFWMFVLINLIIEIILSLLFRNGFLRFIPGLYSLFVLLPSLAVGCRRLHDVGRSGWWQLLALIPLIGIIVLIIWWATDSHPGPNKYGSSPKAIAA